MSLVEIIRSLGIIFLLMGYLVCAMLIYIAINSSKILKHLEKMNKTSREFPETEAVVRLPRNVICVELIYNNGRFRLCDTKYLKKEEMCRDR